MITICTIVCRTFVVRTLLDTQISQLIVCLLTLWKYSIIINGDFFGNRVVVRTVVGNIQTTVTIHERQIAIAIETTQMSCAQCDEVAMIDVMYRRRSIAEDSRHVGKDGSRTWRRVTTSKHGIVDDDTITVQTIPCAIFLVA